MTPPSATDPARRPRIRIDDPDGVLVRRATRVALVLPLLFWVCFVPLDRPVVALFASFGSFAMLAMADFGGPLPRRAGAYLVVTVAGALLVVMGTLASASIPVAVALMLLVGFAVAYLGALGGYYVAAAPPLTLAFVLAATVPAPDPAAIVPERVAGWVTAGLVSVLAAVALWPVHERRRIAEAMSRACRAVATALRTGDAPSCTDAIEAVQAARLRFWRSPRRPAGPSEHDRAVLHLLDALDWLAEILTTPGGLRGSDDDLLEVAAATLDACAVGLDETQPVPVEAIGQARTDHLAHLHEQVTDALAAGSPPSVVVHRIRRSFLPRVASHAAELAAQAATAARSHTSARTLELVLRRAGHLLRAHLHLRSVWFRNSLRMGLALALAVAVALAGNRPHAFWVALGTLTALRSNALGTGRTVMQALTGTIVGFGVTIGVLAITDDPLVLWFVLPIAVFLSAWAPTAVSFVVGQASFTVFVVLLFNLIEPIGWRVGAQRVENIAIGCGVALLASAILWPRGASAQLQQALVESIEADGRWFTAEIDRLLRVGGTSRVDDPIVTTARAAQWRADQALIVYLDERGAHRLPVERAQALVNSGDFLQLAASSMSTNPAIALGSEGPCRDTIERVAGQASSAVDALAAVTGAGPPGPLVRVPEIDLDRCVAAIGSPPDAASVGTAVRLVFAAEWVDRVGLVAARLAGERVDHPLPHGGRSVAPAAGLQQSGTPDPRRQAMNTDGS